MVYQYQLSISGIKILLESDHPLIENSEFNPFRINGSICDLTVRFQQSENLPPVPDVLMYEGECCKIASQDSALFQQFFYENPEDPVHYAVSFVDYHNGFIRVDYLPDYLRCVSEIRNCFFHIGLESMLLCKEKLFLHASCIDTSLGGILFSGVSGIGKSTQAELWCRYRKVKQINGDRPILSKEQDGWFAWGSPYAGSSKCHVNDCCSISAIVMLKKAENCSLHRLRYAEAFRRIWAGLTVHSWQRSFVESASNLTLDLIEHIPVFEFCCTADEYAVDFLEQALQEELNL